MLSPINACCCQGLVVRNMLPEEYFSVAPCCRTCVEGTGHKKMEHLNQILVDIVIFGCSPVGLGDLASEQRGHGLVEAGTRYWYILTVLINQWNHRNTSRGLNNGIPFDF
jgi:hypothetical protein